MKRVYHRHEKWECIKAGFFNKSVVKELDVSKVIELFTSPKDTEIYMTKVIKEWKYSCEQNLTNTSMNRIAWLGQAACCLYAGIPHQTTMESWRKVPVDFQNQANKIAEILIQEYEQNIINE